MSAEAVGIEAAVGPDYTDYRTPEGSKRSVLAGLSPSLGFYRRIAGIVFAASGAARKGRFDDAAWYAASLKIRTAFEACGARVEVEGTRHLAQAGGPVVIIGNHMSTAETFLLASMVLPIRRMTFVVKRGLVEYPVFKHIMRSRDPIVVGREDPRADLKAVMEGGVERLGRGWNVVVFPQRTRKVEFEREGFNSIGVKLAKRAGVKVVPMALKTNAWSNGKWLKDYGPFLPEEPVRFRFGAALEVEGNGREANEAVMAHIETALRDWGMQA